MIRSKFSVAAALAMLASLAVVPACSSNDADPTGPSCTNGVKDTDEQGVDCGGTCATKCTGAGCTSDAECASGKCNAGSCAAPAGKPCGVGAPVAKCADGEKCELDNDCSSGFCDGSTCKTPAAESHTDGVKNSGETGIDCGGSVKATKPCPDGQGCVDSSDCVGTCNAGTCGPAGPTDGKKNNGETDVDCGGPSAPKCDNGKGCAGNDDCKDGYCPDATKKCTAPRYDDGVKNGDETDVDCGGKTTNTGFKRCAEGKGCLVDTDCNAACNYDKKCVDAPSCKPHFGGDTCGRLESNNPGKSHVVKPDGTTAPGHESCCRSLPVAGYADAEHAGKTVYLDKYEITAGRMRAFIEWVAAQNGGNPNVRGYIAAKAPAHWHPDWSGALPTGLTGSMTSYAVSDPTAPANLLYPGQDQYLLNNRTQTTWSVVSGNYSIDVGLYYALQSQHHFPEYLASAGWPSPEYAATHAMNCYNGNDSYGYSTYWFDDATVQNYAGGVKKYFSKDQLDEKAMTCSPFGLFAAFCEWDGGQLATAEVIDYITGNTGSPVYGPTTQNGKFTGGQTCCGYTNAELLGNKACTAANLPGPPKYITYPDGGSVPCAAGYYYPFDDATNTYDGSARIAPPGRLATDVMSINANDEPWMDMMGNLQEAVTRKGETQRFDWRGYGTEWSSISHHRNQASTARMKGGAFGARCMRFK